MDYIEPTSGTTIQDHHNILNHLLDVNDELILDQLEHYLKGLSSDWKGK